MEKDFGSFFSRVFRYFWHHVRRGQGVPRSSFLSSSRSKFGIAPYFFSLCMMCLLSNGSSADQLKDNHLVETSGGAGLSAIAVLSSRYGYRDEVDVDTLQCLHSEIETQFPGTKTLPDKEFRDALYPWFEPRVAPRSKEALKEVLSQPQIQSALHAMNVGYIAWVDREGVGDEGNLGHRMIVWDLQAIVSKDVSLQDERAARSTVQAEYRAGISPCVALIAQLKSKTIDGLNLSGMKLVNF